MRENHPVLPPRGGSLHHNEERSASVSPHRPISGYVSGLVSVSSAKWMWSYWMIFMFNCKTLVLSGCGVIG